MARPPSPSIAGGRFERYFHTCAFVRNREEGLRIIGPFLGEALNWGEKGIYIVDPRSEHEDIERLQQAGTDIAGHPNQFQMLNWNTTYLHDGRFDQDRMVTAISHVIEEGKAQGFPRTRMVGQMGWVFDNHPGVEQVLEYEVKVNDVLTRSQHPAVCIYELERLSGSMIMDLMQAHPMTIIGGVLYENPYYRPAEEFLQELKNRGQNNTAAA